MPGQGQGEVAGLYHGGCGESRGLGIEEKWRCYLAMSPKPWIWS